MRIVIYASLLMIMAVTAGPAFSQVEFIEVATLEDMEAARKKADDGMLLLFVDVYATWCGPCKIMDRDVYSAPAVAEYMNANFVNVRMDGESDFGRKYAAEQQLQGYPSMFIFTGEGDRVSTLVGYKPPETLVPALKQVVESNAELKRYRKQYADGTLTRESFADYITVTREMGNEEEAERLAGEYIKGQMGETLSDNDIRVVGHYMDLEDPWWKQFTTDTDRMKRALGQDYIPVLQKIYNNSLVKAVEQESVRLISRMANELSPLVEAEQATSGDLRTLPFLQYYYYTGQVEELITYVDKRFESDRKGDHRWLFGAGSKIIDMDQKNQTPELLDKGEEWFSTCIGMDEQYDYYFYYGMVLLFRQKMADARTSFEKARALAANPEQVAMVNQVLRYANGQ
ncbi:MAG: thioredoxin family protein [Bacteroidota bacterium]